MKLSQFMNDLLGYFSVQNLLHRPGFKERIENNSLRLQEFIYPLLQGYDGVEMKVDVELGGNDQVFNMSIGRALRKASPKTNKGEKFFVATTLLVNPKTGKKLMNKSEGGLINLDDSPEDIFGKVMALDDESMFPIAEHCTEISLDRITDLKKVNPRDAKLEIAFGVIEVIYGKNKAEKAKEHWDTLFSKKELPSDSAKLKLSGKKLYAEDVVLVSGVVKSKSEARRLIEQGGLKINEKQIKNPRESLTLQKGEKVKIGKKNFFQVA